MCDFKPGDEVICVDGGQRQFPDVGLVSLVEGATYTIASFQAEGEVGDTGLVIGRGGCVQIVELGYLRSGEHCGFRATRFRKVQRRDLSAWLETAATDTDHLDRPIKTPARPKVDALLKRVQSGVFG